jgi:hypothetical protein
VRRRDRRVADLHVLQARVGKLEAVVRTLENCKAGHEYMYRKNERVCMPGCRRCGLDLTLAALDAESKEEG